MFPRENGNIITTWNCLFCLQIKKITTVQKNIDVYVQVKRIPRIVLLHYLKSTGRTHEKTSKKMFVVIVSLKEHFTQFPIFTYDDYFISYAVYKSALCALEVFLFGFLCTMLGK